MLKSEIWLEIIVSAQVECLPVTPSPVLVVGASILPHLVPAQTGRALVVPLGRAKGREQKAVGLAEAFGDIEHI